MVARLASTAEVPVPHARPRSLVPPAQNARQMGRRSGATTSRGCANPPPPATPTRTATTGCAAVASARNVQPGRHASRVPYSRIAANSSPSALLAPRRSTRVKQRHRTAAVGNTSACRKAATPSARPQSAKAWAGRFAVRAQGTVPVTGPAAGPTMRALSRAKSPIRSSAAWPAALPKASPTTSAIRSAATGRATARPGSVSGSPAGSVATGGGRSGKARSARCSWWRAPAIPARSPPGELPVPRRGGPGMLRRREVRSPD